MILVYAHQPSVALRQSSHLKPGAQLVHRAGRHASVPGAVGPAAATTTEYVHPLPLIHQQIGGSSTPSNFKARLCQAMKEIFGRVYYSPGGWISWNDIGTINATNGIFLCPESASLIYDVTESTSGVCNVFVARRITGDRAVYHGASTDFPWRH